MAYALLTQLALVSVTAVFIALVTVLIKRLFGHKLSPALHYFVWVIFAVRLLLPFAPESSLSVGNIIVSAGEGVLEKWQYSRKETAETGEVYEFAETAAAGEVNEFAEAVAAGELYEFAKTAEAGEISETPGAAAYEYPPDGSGYTFYETAESKSLPFSQTVWNALFLIYIAGIIAGTVIYARKLITFTKKIEKTVKPAHQGDVLLFEDVKRQLGIKKEIKLFEGNDSMLIGFVNPSVILAKNCPDADKRAILAHELLHYKNKDNIVNLVLSVISNFYWFNPFIHFFIHRVKDDMEILCDARTIKKLNYRKKDYAMVLFNSSNDNNNDNESRAPLGATQMSAGGEELKTRISFISKFKKPGRIASVIVILIGFVMLFTTLTNPKQNGGGQMEFAGGKTAAVSYVYTENVELAEGKTAEVSYVNKENVALAGEYVESGVVEGENATVSYASAESVEVEEAVDENGEVYYKVYLNGKTAGNINNGNKSFEVTIPNKNSGDSNANFKIVVSENNETNETETAAESTEPDGLSETELELYRLILEKLKEKGKS
jgi:bla regulator protein BlaR1